MTEKDNLISLMHTVSSVSLEFIGSAVATQDIRSRSLDSAQRSMKRYVARNLTNMNRGDTVKKKCSKKYSTTSDEIYPVREKNVIWNKLCTKVDVRHVKETKKFGGINSYALTNTCDENICPVLQERLNQHKNEHHRHHSKPRSTKKLLEKGVNVSPTISSLKLQKVGASLNSVRSVQTDITLHDVVVHKDSLPNTLSYIKDVGAPLKRCETRDIVPNCNFYKEHLQNVIMSWLLNVPIFYSMDFTTKYLKNNIVSVLVDKIDTISPQANKIQYEETVKAEIEECLNNLPMWLPNTMSEQTLFKNALRNKLCEKIKQLNVKFLGVQNENDNIDLNSRSYTKVETIDSDNNNTELIMKEVHAWLTGIKFTRSVSRKHIIDLIMKKISPLLNVSIHTRSYKLILKGEIFDVLDELPISLNNNRSKNVQLTKHAEDLANKLLSVQIKLKVPVQCEFARSRELVAQQCASHIIGIPAFNSHIRLNVYDKVNEVLGNTKINSKSEVKEEICDAIMNSLETLRSGVEININNKIYDILHRTNTITEEKAKSIAKKIKLYLKVAFKQQKVTRKSSFQYLNPQLSGVLSVYRSNSNNPVTSTPKKPTIKDIPKLNPEQISYMNKVADLIRAWMETLPNNFDDDKNYKETMINDLAGDIMDEVKREQLSPETNTEKDQHLNYYVHRWLFRFDVFDDLNDAKPMIESFLEKLKQIPVPVLTAPQHGTRQAIHNLKRSERDFNYYHEFAPIGIDILEDQISVWMNEQPSEIYANDKRKKRHKMIKDLALKIQDRLRNKSPENEIENDVNQWLKQVVKAKEKEHIGLLTHSLTEKLIKVPQDKTLEARHEKRMRQRAKEYVENEPSTATPKSEHVREQEDPDNTMKEFIFKYTEHNYDIDDPMARGAFAELLKIELRKLNPPTRKEVYDNFAKEASHEQFKPEKLNEVLEFIKIISDWLRNIPIQPFYNTIGNTARIEFVNDLARNIQEVEKQRKENPNDMDYDLFISSIISRSLRTYEVPVLPEHLDNEPLMVNELLSKIVANRSLMAQNVSTISDIREQNLSKFIEEYILINGREIADDKLKLEAWIALLQEEIKKMIYEGVDPSTLCKGQVYENISKVPIPGKDAIRRFSSEIAHVKKISDWIKNLPLLPIDNVPKAQEEMIKMISELAQKIEERKIKKNADPTDNAVDKDLVQYISNWISKLPLDPRKDIIVPIVIQQLMNSIEKDVKSETLPDNSQFKETVNRKVYCDPKNIEAIKDPGAHIVQYIENWCNKLPIQGDNPEAVKILKDEIATNLYQKIGELNVEPRIYNDSVLFKNLLEDEIDTQFENLPQTAELQSHKESLKAELLNTILDMQKLIEQKSTGDNYKHNLEIAIDAAIPDPIQSRQVLDPGFEIYKNHLANMFILDNFDHSNEDVKAIYENKIREEIDKYFEYAQNKNALPVTKDELFNEIYSELFKVPMPNKESVIDEVEEVKTRCEVEAWFEKLPLKEADGICEYLEWEQIVSTLAKRIHEIEKNESNPDEHMRKEIGKWLEKLPLLPGNEGSINQYIDKLQRALKSTQEARKYVPTQPTKVFKGKAIQKPNVVLSPNISQVAGPYRKGDTWVSPPPSPGLGVSKLSNKIIHTPKKKSGDLIIETVEDWCNQLPIIGDQAQIKIIKDNISTQIVMKICELNMDSNIFNDDIIYNQLLDEELEKIISDLVGCCELERSKTARKYQLKEMIKSIQPLIKEEKKRHEYKEELNNTVASILNDHSDTKAKLAEFNKLKNDIVDYSVEFNYNRSDNEARQIYKTKVHGAVVDYVTRVQDKDQEVDPLVRRNQLLCELSKIPVPNNEVLKEEVEEIKMKNEVELFFEKNSLNDNTDKTTQMKKTLTKRLNETEKLGHTDSNEKKMNSEITKCLVKINKKVSPKAISKFVNHLKNNEAQRKSPPLNKTPANVIDERRSVTLGSACAPCVPQVAGTCPGCRQTVIPLQTRLQQPAQYLQTPNQLNLPICSCGQQRGPLEFATALPSQPTKYYDPNIRQGVRPEAGVIWNQPPADQVQNALLQGYTPNLRQTADLAPAQRATYVHEIDVCKPVNIQAIDAYPEPLNRVPDANVYPQSQCYTRNPHPPMPQQSQYNGYQNCGVQLQQNVAPPSKAEVNQGQLIQQDQFKPPASFPLLPPDYITPDQVENLNQRPQSNVNVHPYSPSVSQRSVHEIPVYGKVATPRIVQGEALPSEPLATEAVAPETVFQPPFETRPLYNRLTVPGGEPEHDRPTRPTSVSSSRQTEPREVYSSENMRYRCICNKKFKKFNNGPYCMIPMEEYCDDCGGFYPMWCRVPLPPYFYLH